MISDGVVVVEGSECDEKLSPGVSGRLVSASTGVVSSSSDDRRNEGTTSLPGGDVVGEEVVEGVVGISGCSGWAVSS